jgi:hypothetical protein
MADEAHHRDVNHTFADMKSDDPNPFVTTHKGKSNRTHFRLSAAYPNLPPNFVIPYRRRSIRLEAREERIKSVVRGNKACPGNNEE